MSDNNKMPAKIFITGKIEARTGLHIGGSNTALDIGGIDLNVIKTAKGVPFIPGSSLKGKIRSLLEVSYGFDGLCRDVDPKSGIAHIFGVSADKNSNGVRTHLIVRDSFLDKDDFKKKFRDELELQYTEGKWENTIDRLTSKAKNPRQLERVPAGALFNFEMIYTVFNSRDVDYIKTVIEGMRLLEDDYIGGSGSRGYGKVKFNDLKIEYKTRYEYVGTNKRQQVTKAEYKDISFGLDELLRNIKESLEIESN